MLGEGLIVLTLLKKFDLSKNTFKLDCTKPRRENAIKLIATFLSIMTDLTEIDLTEIEYDDGDIEKIISDISKLKLTPKSPIASDSAEGGVETITAGVESMELNS